MHSFFKDIQLPFLLLLLLQSFLLVRLDWLTSPNRTELGHMAAALRLWESGTFDLFHVNPPLMRFLISSAVSYSVHPRTDWSDYSADPLKRSEWACGVAFIRANDLDTVRASFFIGRALCIPLILLGGYFGYRFALELFGNVSGFVFLILWTFSPFILGWGSTICPDVVGASLGIITLYMFRHWLRKPTWGNTFCAGVTLGLLPLTKLTWIVAFGIWLLVWLLILPGNRKEMRKQIVQMVLILGVGILVINAGYLFDGSFKALGSYPFHSQALTDEHRANRFINTALGKIPVPLPEHFVLGFDTQKIDFETGLPSYLFGKHSEHGWWFYYLVVLAVKETFGTLLLFAFAFILFFFKPFRGSWQDEIILTVPMVFLFTLISLQTGFSLHSRYMLSFLPFFYLWISRIGNCLAVDSKPMLQCTAGLILALILLSNIISVLSVYPYVMSYHNEAARDRVPPVLLGSNLDWGQDYYELKEYLDAHPEARPLQVAFSTIFPIEVLNIVKTEQPPRWRENQIPDGTWQQQISIGPQPGWFLFGANELFGENGDYQWLWNVKPVKRIGYSLYIYHISLEETNQLREKYGLPMLIEEDILEK